MLVVKVVGKKLAHSRTAHLLVMLMLIDLFIKEKEKCVGFSFDTIIFTPTRKKFVVLFNGPA